MFSIADYGYGRLSVVNRTHMQWVYQDDGAGKILDSVWIVKHSHGPFNSFAVSEVAQSPAVRQAALAALVSAIEGQPGEGKRITGVTARGLAGKGVAVGRVRND